jgi:hypothetical protein
MTVTYLMFARLPEGAWMSLTPMKAPFFRSLPSMEGIWNGVYEH